MSLDPIGSAFRVPLPLIFSLACWIAVSHGFRLVHSAGDSNLLGEHAVDGVGHRLLAGCGSQGSAGFDSPALRPFGQVAQSVERRCAHAWRWFNSIPCPLSWSRGLNGKALASKTSVRRKARASSILADSVLLEA